ncbi:mitochondrial fission factor isoform X9 [Ornithorhynchus anatinus]|uniref:mitochondrial fission factor isoform X9 n=1 Tax=Ornithorhynchus anatinus TaxID=9258 RepID=UPI0019D463CB|nr:mitochondrial fission factor isoform X9 [Ornithorhynchus anatinus]
MSKRASSESPLGRMSGAAFPSPTAEMAEMNRIQYEMEYTEGISQRMRVPEKLKVAPPNADLEQGLDEGIPNASVTMQVPERIVIAGNNDDIPFSRPADLGLIQSTPFKPLALKTPPRVLTLSERPLDFLDLERSVPPTPQTEDEKLHLEEEPCQQQIRAVGRLKRERSMSENAVRQNGQLVRNDSMWHRSDSAPRNKISRFQSSLSAPGYIFFPDGDEVWEKGVTPSQQQARVCAPHMLPEDGSNLYSARGILSLIQSSTRRAYQQVLDVLDENRRETANIFVLRLRKNLNNKHLVQCFAHSLCCVGGLPLPLLLTLIMTSVPEEGQSLEPKMSEKEPSQDTDFQIWIQQLKEPPMT